MESINFNITTPKNPTSPKFQQSPSIRKQATLNKGKMGQTFGGDTKFGETDDILGSTRKQD